MTVGTILVIIVGICVSGLLCSIDPVRHVDVETEYGIVRGTKESIVLTSWRIAWFIGLQEKETRHHQHLPWNTFRQTASRGSQI